VASFAIVLAHDGSGLSLVIADLAGAAVTRESLESFDPSRSIASLRFDGANDLVDSAVDHVLARSSTSGGKLTFNEEVDGGFRRILTTQLRSNCAVLSAITRLDDLDSYGLGDKPMAMTRAITQTRGNRDHWENTQENMFCMNALIDYSRVYESDAPDMTLMAYLDAEVLGRAKFTDLRDDPVAFQRSIGAADPGRAATVKLERQGPGRLYYSACLTYAPQTLKTEPINGGIEIHREYSLERDGNWELLTGGMQLKRGDLVRIDLFVSLPTARNFVVVDDPVPGGLEPVNRDLATASTVDADQGAFQAAGGSWWFRYSDWSSYGLSRWSFYHRELRHNAARFYSEYLPAGNYHLSYTAQAVAPGKFVVLPVQAEEMYDPDVFGQGGAAELEIRR